MLASRRLGSDPQLQKAAVNNPPLVRGVTGSGVSILQDVLADLGFMFPKTFARGTADGIFGPETEAAVKGFQARKALKADGIAGARTLHALDEEVLANGRLELVDGHTDLHSGYW